MEAGPQAPGRETLVPPSPLHASSTLSYCGLDQAIVTFQKKPRGWSSKATLSVACDTGARRRRSTCRAPAGPVALVPRLGLGAGSSVAGRCPRDCDEGHTRAAAMTVTQFPAPPSAIRPGLCGSREPHGTQQPAVLRSASAGSVLLPLSHLSALPSHARWPPPPAPPWQSGQARPGTDKRGPERLRPRSERPSGHRYPQS